MPHFSQHRWALWAGLYILGCWLLLWKPDAVLVALPRWSPASQQDQSLSEVRVPKSLFTIWKLGRCAARLEDPQLRPAALREASELLQVSNISDAAVAAIGLQLQQAEAQQVGKGRIARALSFVNLLWAVGIVGIAVSAFPALAWLLGPLLSWLLRQSQALLLVLRPLGEALAFAVSFYPAAASARMDVGTTAAAFVALSGAALSIPALLFSLEAVRSERNSGLNLILNTFVLLTFSPLAILQSSKLLGFLASAALFGALGFSVVPFGLGWCIGWSDKHTMRNTQLAAAIIMTALAAVKALAAEPGLLEPFRLGMSVFGALTFGLAGIITTSSWHASNHKEYVRSNLLFGGEMIAAIGIGMLLGLPPMVNTAIVLLVLWLSEKLFERTIEKHIWPVIFCSSIALWQAALWCHQHPAFMQSLLE